MPELDEKIYEFIKAVQGKNYLGRTLRQIEGNFVWGTKGPREVDVWASLSRLTQARRIRKSGSHRYKSYVAIGQHAGTRESGGL